jgi:hypothetical protein
MVVYCVLCTTKQKNPFIELVTEIKAVADQVCEMHQEKGLFAIVVEKKLNRFPEKRVSECLNKQ